MSGRPRPPCRWPGGERHRHERRLTILLAHGFTPADARTLTAALARFVVVKESEQNPPARCSDRRLEQGPRNFVTMHRFADSPVARKTDDRTREAIDTKGETIEYSVTPVHRTNDPIDVVSVGLILGHPKGRLPFPGGVRRVRCGPVAILGRPRGDRHRLAVTRADARLVLRFSAVPKDDRHVMPERTHPTQQDFAILGFPTGAAMTEASRYQPERKLWQPSAAPEGDRLVCPVDLVPEHHRVAIFGRPEGRPPCLPPTPSCTRKCRCDPRPLQRTTAIGLLASIQGTHSSRGPRLP